MIMKAHEKLD